MKKLDERIKDYLIEKGFYNTEQQTTTYKCTSDELKSYEDYGGAYPKEDTAGDAEFTKTEDIDVADELTPEEINLLIQMESEKHLRIIKGVAVFFVVLVAISLILTLIQYAGISAAIKDLTKFKLY